MPVIINRALEEIHGSIRKVSDRVREARDSGRGERIEITQQEAFDLFNRQTTSDVVTGRKRTEGVDLSEIEVGVIGDVFGYPCVIVERLRGNADA